MVIDCGAIPAAFWSSIRFIILQRATELGGRLYLALCSSGEFESLEFVSLGLESRGTTAIVVTKRVLVRWFEMLSNIQVSVATGVEPYCNDGCERYNLVWECVSEVRNYVLGGGRSRVPGHNEVCGENQVQTVGASVKKFDSEVVDDLLSPSFMDPVKLSSLSCTGVHKKPKINAKEEPKRRLFEDQNAATKNSKRLMCAPSFDRFSISDPAVPCNPVNSGDILSTNLAAESKSVADATKKSKLTLPLLFQTRKNCVLVRLHLKSEKPQLTKCSSHNLNLTLLLGNPKKLKEELMTVPERISDSSKLLTLQSRQPISFFQMVLLIEGVLKMKWGPNPCVLLKLWTTSSTFCLHTHLQDQTTSKSVERLIRMRLTVIRIYVVLVILMQKNCRYRLLIHLTEETEGWNIEKIMRMSGDDVEEVEGCILVARQVDAENERVQAAGCRV